MSEQDERPAGGSGPAEERTSAGPAEERTSARPAGSQAMPTDAVEQAQASPAADGTGDDRVDQALGRLAELDATPVHEHAAVVEAIHRSLQDALAEDEG